MLRALRLNPRRNPEIGERMIYVEVYKYPHSQFHGQPRWLVESTLKEYGNRYTGDQAGWVTRWHKIPFEWSKPIYFQSEDPKSLALELGRRNGVQSEKNVYLKVYGYVTDHPYVLQYSMNWPEEEFK